MQNCLSVKIFSPGNMRFGGDSVKKDSIAQYVRTKHWEEANSNLQSYTNWRDMSNAGLFSRRYSLLKRIDKDLLLYYQRFTSEHPEKLIKRCDALLTLISIHESKRPNSKRREAMDTLKEQIKKDKIAFDLKIKDSEGTYNYTYDSLSCQKR